MATIELIQPMALSEEMYDPPTGDEAVAALSRLKVGKAAGSNGYLPDILSWILLFHCLVQCGGTNRFPWNGVIQL